MKFELSTSSWRCTEHDAEYLVLKKLGFDFEFSHVQPDGTNCYSIDGTPTIEINTLLELAALQKEVVHPLIIDGNTIEIYDDYRE